MAYPVGGNVPVIGVNHPQGLPALRLPPGEYCVAGILPAIRGRDALDTN
jgi:hypothetical protein